MLIRSIFLCGKPFAVSLYSRHDNMSIHYAIQQNEGHYVTGQTANTVKSHA